MPVESQPPSANERAATVTVTPNPYSVPNGNPNRLIRERQMTTMIWLKARLDGSAIAAKTKSAFQAGNFQDAVGSRTTDERSGNSNSGGAERRRGQSVVFLPSLARVLGRRLWQWHAHAMKSEARRRWLLRWQRVRRISSAMKDGISKCNLLEIGGV